MEKQRILSVDIFRGLTMFMMILVNNPGDWGNVYAPLLHAEWHGWTPTDLVFPFFVIVMGLVIPISTDASAGLTKAGFLKIFARSLRLIALGMFLNFFSRIDFGFSQGLGLMLFRLMITGFVGYLLLGNFQTHVKLYIAAGILCVMILLAFSGLPRFETVRLPGVLQRLGLVYFFASIIYLTCSFRTQVIIAVIVLLGYWLLMGFVPVPGSGVTGFEKGANIANWLDGVILQGHVWGESRPWDPEGILSTLPAIISCVIGVWGGLLIKQKDHKKNLALVGLALFIGGLIWNFFFPINKALWSSSFVLLTAGLAFMIVALFSVLFNNKPLNAVTSFLIMWGVNPIIIFFGSGIFPRAIDMLKAGGQPLSSAFYNQILVPMFTEPKNSSLVFALCNILVWSLVLFYLKKKNIIIKV